ncbi:rhamnulokinase family protein [soil metagenome]
MTTVDLDASVPHAEVIHRWKNAPIKAADGSLRWDWPKITSEVQAGITKALTRGPVVSIGVEGWANDYGLIDKHGDLVALPYSYRDQRTRDWAALADRLGADRIHAITGIQLISFNTLFQLGLHDRQELERANRILLLPDLMVHQLSGFEGAERSNASTTAMLGVQDGQWSSELADAIGLPKGVLPDIVAAPRQAGSWQGIPVTTVGSHDTASAFLGMPGHPGNDTVCVSSGTWVIVGVERETADLSERARHAGFSNERGALGGFRFLKNLTGFWMLEQCRIAWGNPPLDVLLHEAEDTTGPVPLVDAADHRFISPASMVEEIVAAAGFGRPPSRGEVVRCILESIVHGIVAVIDELSALTGTEMRRVFVAGGASRAGLFNQLIARETGLPVVVGSSEATALGNALAQGLGVGYFSRLEEGRQWLGTTGKAI